MRRDCVIDRMKGREIKAVFMMICSNNFFRVVVVVVEKLYINRLEISSVDFLCVYFFQDLKRREKREREKQKSNIFL